MADSSAYKQIHFLKKEVRENQASRDEWAQLIPELEGMLAEGFAEAAASKTEAEDAITALDKKLAQLQDELAELEATLPKKPEPAAPKFDVEKHPLLKKTVEKIEPAKPVVFNAGDMCEAQYTDRLWYKAKVQTVLGSASDPKYHVRFLDYKDSYLTIDRDAIRPIVNEKKRKADAAPTPPTGAPTTSSPHVISGPASVNPNAVAAKKELEPDTSVPINRRKIGGSKALERKTSNWKNFQSKGPGKQFAKKDSMFRSGTTVNSRVGFTGSGAGMSATHKRIRYNGKGGEEEGEGQDWNGIAAKSRERRDDWQSRSQY